MTDQMQHLDQWPEVIDQGEAEVRWGKPAADPVVQTIFADYYSEVEYTRDEPAGLWRRVR